MGELYMGWIRPVPVEKKDIKIGNQYYTCTYSDPYQSYSYKNIS